LSWNGGVHDLNSTWLHAKKSLCQLS
jgi:hypothetical protein